MKVGLYRGFRIKPRAWRTAAATALAASVLPTAVYAATSTWTGGAAGWNTPALWSTSSVPGDGDDVRIDGGNAAVASTVSVSGQAYCRSLLIDAGDRLSLAAGASGQALNVSTDVTVNGALTIGGDNTHFASSLAFRIPGPHLLDGTGEVVFGGTDGLINRIGMTQGTGGTITLGPGILVHGSNGYVGGIDASGVTVVNNGTISADAQGSFGIQVSNVHNAGVLRAANGAKLAISTLLSNTGTIEVGANSSAVISANLRSDQFGAIVRGAGSTLALSGSVDNQGRTWDIDTTTGAVTLSGDVAGGTITASAGSRLRTPSGANFENVTLRAIQVDGFSAYGDLTLDGATTGGITFYGHGSNDPTPVFVNGTGTINGGLRSNAAAPVTLGAGVVVRGNSLRVDGVRSQFINRGTILADGPRTPPNDGVVLVNVSNSGTVRATNHAEVLAATFNNAADGTVTVDGGGTFTLYKEWRNDGVINVADGTLNIGSAIAPAFTKADLGTLNRTAASTINLAGKLNNVGQTLNLNSTTGPWILKGGTIDGGAVASEAGGGLVIDSGYLVGVTLNTTPTFARPGSGAGVGGTLTLTGQTIDLGGGSTGDYGGFGLGSWGGPGSNIVGTGEFLLGHPQAGVSGKGSIGADIYIHGANGKLQGAGGAETENLVLLGRLDADGAGGTVELFGVTNQGTVRALNGVTLNLTGGWSNKGTITADGTSTVNLGGAFSVSDVGTFSRAPSTAVNLTGTLENTGQTLTLDASTGPWVMRGGTITGGTVNVIAPASLIVDNGVFQSVTLNNAPVFSRPGATLTVGGTVTLNNVTLDLSDGGGGPNYGVLKLGATLTGTGEVWLGHADSKIDGSGTIGPGVLVHGAAGQIVGGVSQLRNQGTIASDVVGGELKLSNVNNNGGTVRVDAGASMELLAPYQNSAGTTRVDGTMRSASTITARGGTIAGGGTVTLTGGAKLLVNSVFTGATLDGVTVDGPVEVAANAKLNLGNARPTVGTLTNNGKVDALSGGLHITSDVTESALRAQIIAGRNGGNWAGTTGITSSIAAASGGQRHVGYVMTGASGATIAYAASGDTDLNRNVNTDDIHNIVSAGKLDANVDANWQEGDFNYDHRANTDDILQILSEGVFDAGPYTRTGDATTTNLIGTSPMNAKLIYNPANGNVTVDGNGLQVNGFNLEDVVADSTNVFAGPQAPNFPDGGLSTTDADTKVGWAAIDSSFTGVVDLGNIALPNLTASDLLAQLSGLVGQSNETYYTASTPLGRQNFDLVVVPEPVSLGLLGIAGVGLLRRRRRQPSAH